MGRERPQQDSRKKNGLPEQGDARNKDKLLADREVHAKESKLSGHRVEHDAKNEKKKEELSGHRVARDFKDDKHPRRRVEQDVRGKGHREEQDAHREGAGDPPHQDDKLFAGCTTTRPKENKLSGHYVARDGPKGEVPDVQKPRQKNLQPAGLALGKIEEMDPLHAELSEFLDRQQIAYLKAISSRIEDKEFEDFMKQGSFEEKMSNYAGGEDHLPRESVTRNRKPSLSIRPTGGDELDKRGQQRVQVATNKGRHKTSQQRWQQRAGDLLLRHRKE